MRKFYFSFFALISLTGIVKGQEAQVLESSATQVNVPRSATVNISRIKVDFFPQILDLEMPEPGVAGEKDHNSLEEIKERIKRRRYKDDPAPSFKLNEDLPAAVQDTGFDGNSFNAGVPNDNDMAISNGGMIVSVINSTLNVYDAKGKLIKSSSLDAIASQLGLPESKYDPRALYDPDADRFLVAFLNGRHDSTSYIILAFSQTNDPAGDWNIYKLSGNPLKDTTWSDYPIIAFSKNELFLTINALQNNKSWQEGFVRSYIWQIDKNNGYQGDSLRTKVHHNIYFNGRPLRNLCPVQGGSGLTGPKMFFLSDRNFAEKNDTIFLLELNSLLGSASHQLQLRVLTHPGHYYGVPPTARQPKNREFATNDARILDAIIENDQIQFVSNSHYFPSGLAGVMHGRIVDAAVAPKLVISVLGDDNLDYGYPSIAYAGRNSVEDDAIIFFNHSSDTVPAGNSCIYYSQGSYAPLKRLKAGISVVSVISGEPERWGDYSGAQPKYDKPGEVWVSGSYGKPVRDGGLTQFVNATWISQIHNPDMQPTPEPDADEVKVYPNLLTQGERVVVKFRNKEASVIRFGIYDVTGRLLHDLMTESVPAGPNSFSFIPTPLSPGMYMLVISRGNEKLSATKFMVK